MNLYAVDLHLYKHTEFMTMYWLMKTNSTADNLPASNEKWNAGVSRGQAFWSAASSLSLHW
jgi:hypothetical protein